MPMKPKLFAALLVLILLVLPSCKTYESVPELVAANKMQGQALEGAVVNRKKVVDAYTKELMAAYRKQMELITTLALANAMQVGDDGVEMVPVSVVNKVNAEREKRERELEAQLEAKAAEFMDDPNFDVARQLNGAVSRWMDAHVTQFAGRIESIIELGKQIVDPDE